MEKLLQDDPDYFAGQIIFQKDGYNMVRRSPVADGLAEQLRLLNAHGYRVVTVSELLAHSPLRDVLPESADGVAAKRLLESGWCIAYRDNTLRADAPLTRGELAMMGYGWDAVAEHVAMRKMGNAPFRDLSHRHPYAAAAKLSVQAGALTAHGGRFRPNAPVTAAELQQFCHVRLGVLPDLGAISKPNASDRSTVACFTHGECVRLLASLLPQT